MLPLQKRITQRFDVRHLTVHPISDFASGPTVGISRPRAQRSGLHAELGSGL